MTIVLKDRVKVESSVTGTGTVTLGAAPAGYQDFSAVGDGNTTYYTIASQSGADWEVGYGTVSESAGTWYLTRESVLSSSNANTLVNFSAGTKDVFVTYPAEKAVYEEQAGNVLVNAGPITVVGAGVTSYTSFDASLGEFYANVNSYAQLYAQNLSNGSDASTDIVAYNDLGDGTYNFVDMGIASSNYSSVDYPIFTAGSAYLYNDGGELLIGSDSHDVVLFAGGVDTTDEALRIDAATKQLTTTQDFNVTGDVLAVGGAFTGPVTSTSSMASPGDTEFVTKAYVDNATAAGLDVHPAVDLEHPGNLAGTYDNGTAGVGATLTNNGTQAVLVADGVEVSNGNRILFYEQTDATENGVYVVTDKGSASTNWVLTRASDADTYAPSSATALSQGSYFFVSGGTTAAGESYVVSTSGTIVFGTTDINFSQFAAAQSYIAESPLNLAGNTFSLAGVVDYAHGGTGQSSVATGDLLYGSATNTWGKLAKGDPYKSLRVSAAGNQLEWSAVPLNQPGSVSGVLPVPNGGTGIASYQLGDMIFGFDGNNMGVVSGSISTTKVFFSQTGTGSASAPPVWSGISSSDVSGLAASATTDTTVASNITSGTLSTGRISGVYTGITGVGTLTNGTWNATTIAVNRGGTGKTQFITGDVLYASASTIITGLNAVATGNALLSGGVGTAPAWGKVGLTTHVSGTLPIGNGGTGATDAAGARTELGASTVGANIFTLTNPSAVTFPRFNADNTVSALDAASFRGAIGAGTGNGTVTSVTGGAYLTGGAITTSGTLAVDATSTNTVSKVVARDAAGNFSAGTITANLTGNATTATTATTATNVSSGGTISFTRYNPRWYANTSQSTLFPDIAAYDMYQLTGQILGLSIAAPAGTPTNGNKILFSILDNGTSRTISWNAVYRAVGVTLPTATVAGKILYVGCIYNLFNGTWDVIAVSQEA